jgi:putative DNA primase/helicase
MVLLPGGVGALRIRRIKMESIGNGSAFQAVPEQLKRLHGWMASGGEDGKVTLDARGNNASRAVADNWRSFDEVVAQALAQGGGIGWVIQPGYVVLDVDRAFDEGGEIRKQFQALTRVATYIERSVSGTGLHIFLRSEVRPEGQKVKGTYSDGSALEILAPGWFVRTTGDKLESSHDLIKTGDEIVSKALEHVRDRKGEKPSEDGHAGEPGPGNSLTDEEVLDRAASAPNGETFSRLMDGDTSAHAGDDSGADLALCNFLRFWSGGDRGQMDRLFRRSGLMRAKWDERRGASTYGQKTIALSLKTREFYTDRSLQEGAAKTSGEPTGLKGRQLIGKAITDGIEPPAMLIDGMLYEGMVHAWHGEPGAGRRSWPCGPRSQGYGGGEEGPLSRRGGLRADRRRAHGGLGSPPEVAGQLLPLLPVPRRDPLREVG